MISQLKSVFLLMSCCLLCTASLAQVGVGVRGGVVFSHFNYELQGENFNSDNIASYVLGIPVEVRLPGPIGFQAEANVMARGDKQQDLLPNSPRDVENRFTYLELTTLGKFGITSKKFELAAIGGPTFGYAITGRQIVDGQGRDVNFSRGESFGRSDLGAVLGFQVGLPGGSGRFILDGRYRLGLNELTAEAPGANLSVKSRAFSMAVGYMFGLGL